jgi:hypothetical protein
MNDPETRVPRDSAQFVRSQIYKPEFHPLR